MSYQQTRWQIPVHRASPLIIRGGARNFPTGGQTLSTRGLKYGFQGTINAKNGRKNRRLFTFRRGASILRCGNYSPLALPSATPAYHMIAGGFLTAFHCKAEVSAKPATPVYRGHMIKPVLEIFIASATGAGYVLITDGCSSTVSVLLLLQVKQLKSAK